MDTTRSGGAVAAEPAVPTLRSYRLLAWQLCALAGQVSAVHLARLGHRAAADTLSNVSMAVVFGSVLWVLTRPQLTRVARNVAVGCLAVTSTLMARATDPLLFTGFDEQLHMRTFADIIASHRLFQPNPVLEISPRYPGLETVTAVFYQIGLPPMLAAVTVILVARLVLVFVLCDAVEHLTKSSRAGGLAVAQLPVRLSDTVVAAGARRRQLRRSGAPRGKSVTAIGRRHGMPARRCNDTPLDELPDCRLPDRVDARRTGPGQDGCRLLRTGRNRGNVGVGSCAAFNSATIFRPHDYGLAIASQWRSATPCIPGLGGNTDTS